MRKGIVFLTTCLLTITGSGTANAKDDDFDTFMKNAKAKFEQFKKEKQNDYEEYRKRVNDEFAGFMSEKWALHKAQPSIEPTPLPEPPVPIVKKEEEESTNDQIIPVDITPAPAPISQPEPVVQIPNPEQPVTPTFSVNFYGRQCYVPLERQHRFTLADATEKSASAGWKNMSQSDFNPVINACLKLRSDLNLCDWGYFKLLEDITTSFFPKSQLNEARLMQMYILTQSGYKVRIGRVNNRLVLLIPSDERIFNYRYISTGNESMYIIDKETGGSGVYLLDAQYPGEQVMSLTINRFPDLPIEPTNPRTLTSTQCSEASVSVSENKNLINFLNDYPRHDAWNLMARASISDYAKNQIYPNLRKVIADKSQRDAANILLQWVQTAFQYKTDDAQFGEERPLYADETLFYPYCDCEDRSIIYSILVRELMGLDALLLYYPRHMATAVAFTETVSGDYLYVDGKRYTICDPTYIGADVGDTMPMFKDSNVTVIKI